MRHVCSFFLALSLAIVSTTFSSTVSFAQVRGYATTAGIDLARIEAARIAKHRQIQQEKDLLREAKREAQIARWKRAAFVAIPAAALAALGYKYFVAPDQVKNGLKSRASGFFGFFKKPKAAAAAAEAAEGAASGLAEESRVVYGGQGMGTGAAATAAGLEGAAGATENVAAGLGGASEAAGEAAAGLNAAAETASTEGLGAAAENASESVGERLKNMKDSVVGEGKRVAGQISENATAFKTRIPQGRDLAIMGVTSVGTVFGLIYDREVDRFESEVDRALARLEILERDLGTLDVLSEVTSR